MLVDGLEPLGADLQSDPTLFAGQPETVLVDVRVPAPPGFLVRVGDVVAEHWFASGHIAFV